MHQTWKMRLLFLALGVLVARPAASDETKPPVAGQSVELDDPLEVLVPLRPRSSRDTDRVQALALFAAGRVAEQKQELPRALRCYERAYRFDPQAVGALREIVPLAFNLDRQAEAVRYALIMAEHDPTDAVLLRRLGIHLSEEGETERALKLYEKAEALHQQAKEKPSASLVLLSMEMGRLYFVNRQFDQAARHFRDVIKAIDEPKEHGLDPTMQKALINKGELTYQLFAEAFLEAGKTEEALAAFDKANRYKPDETLLAYNEARVLARQKQPADAILKLETYFTRHAVSQGTAPYQLLADALEQLSQRDQLLARLEKLRAADPDNMPLAYFLAQQYRQAGQFDKAAPIYLLLVERNKARPPVEAYQGLVEIYRQQKDAAKLLAILGEAVARSGTLEPLGDSATALAADVETSRAVVNLARQQLADEGDKSSHGTHLAAALLAIELQDFAAADALFNAALKVEGAKASEVLLTWGLELFLANQFADAVKVFERALNEKAIPDDNPAVHFYLAGALEMSGRTDEAIAAARKGADLKKDSPRFASRAAWIEYHAKRYDAARKSYAELITRFDPQYDVPESREVVHEARLVLSNISVLEGKMKESEEWIEQVLDEFPEDPGALNDLGYLWADGGKHLERALQMIQVAVAAEPKNMAYRDSLGWVLFRLGRFPEAVAELKTAAAVEEPDGVILDHLAEAQFASGDLPGAIESWQRAAGAFEKHAEAEKVAQTREKITRAQQPSAKNQQPPVKK
jgi:tetratricopeptide (TPR) repeat protein